MKKHLTFLCFTLLAYLSMGINPGSFAGNVPGPEDQAGYQSKAGTQSLPNPAMLNNPKDGQNVGADHVYLEWEAYSHPEHGHEAVDGFRVYLDQSYPPQTLIYEGPDTWYYLENLDWGVTYYWIVVPYNSEGEAQDVPVWSFTNIDYRTFWLEDFYFEQQWVDDELVIAPGYEYPSWDIENHTGAKHTWSFNGLRADIVSSLNDDDENDFEHVWSTLTSQPINCQGQGDVQLFVNMELFNQDEFETYYGRIEISTDQINWHEVDFFEDDVNEQKLGWGLPYHQYDISEIADNQPQLWIRFEFNGNTDRGAGWSLDKVGLMSTNAGIMAATPTLPKNNAVDVDVNWLGLYWQKELGKKPDGYKLYFDTVNPPLELVYDEPFGEWGNSYMPENVQYATTYYWQVVPYDVNGDLEDAPVWTFTTLGADGIYALPHHEGFDNVSIPALPENWQKRIVSTNSMVTIETVNTQTDPFKRKPVSEPNHLRFSNTSHPGAGLYLISPKIYPDKNNLRVRFYAKVRPISGHPETVVDKDVFMEVGTMSNPSNHNTFTPIKSLLLTEEYTQYMVSFEEYWGFDDHIVFRAVIAENDFHVYLDEIIFEKIPQDPLLTILPGSHNFGDVLIHSASEPKSFLLQNNGGGVLTVSPDDISLQGNDADAFILDGITESIQLEAFENVAVSVVYHPESGGAHTAVLKVGEEEVVISGNSIDPIIRQLPYFNDFETAMEPVYPIGWSSINIGEGAITNSGEFVADTIRFSRAVRDGLAEHNYFVYRKESLEADLYLVSPLIELSEEKEYVWVTFSASSFHLHNFIEVGIMSDPMDEATFTGLEKVSLFAGSFEFWEYAVRIPFSQNGIHIALRADFYPTTPRYVRIENFGIVEAPQLYAASFQVMENSDSGHALENATVRVIRHSPLLARDYVADSNGNIDLLLEAGTYTAFVNANGYQEEWVEFTVRANASQPQEFKAEMTHVIIPPFKPVVSKDEQEAGSVLFSWNDPGEVYEFRHDAGVVDDAIGNGNHYYEPELRALGTSFGYYAEVQQVSWLITDLGGPHDTIQMWVVALDKYGFPNQNDVLYWNDKTPNVDNEWTTYTLPEPIIAPNGFAVFLGYRGFLSLAYDDGITHPWQYKIFTQWLIGGMHNPHEFPEPICWWGFPVNLMIRAHGYMFEELAYEEFPWEEMKKRKSAMSRDDAELAQGGVSSTIDTRHPEVKLAGVKSMENFNIFLNDMAIPFASWINDVQYQFTQLAPGTYTAGVQTAYSTGVSRIVDVSFEIADYTTGVQDPDFANLRVFPNPATSVLNIYADEPILEVRMFDMLGQQVFATDGFSEQIQLNVNAFKGGMYFLQITTSKGTVTRKVQLNR